MCDIYKACIKDHPCQKTPGPCRKNTGLFKMIFGVQLSSGNSAPNSGNNRHLTNPFEGGMDSFKRQGVCVSRN